MASKASVPETTGETVTVACNMPNGLLLRIFEMREDQEPVMGGGWRKAEVAVQVGSSVIVNGNAIPVGVPTDRRIESGYALTYGVSKQFWDVWKEQNKISDLVKNRVIFAYGDNDSVKDFARENKDTKSGLEPLHVDKAGQLDDVRTKGTRIKTADEQPKSGASA